MSNTDLSHILNHLSLKKSRNRWRWLAFGALVLLVIALVPVGRFDTPRGDHVARLEVSGLITGEERQLQLIRDLAEEDGVKALVIRIDSPGGTTVGSEALYEELRKFGAKKPVVAVMDSIAASGGYITALAADRIYARGNTITGSIGVIFSYPDVSQLLGSAGIKMEEVKSAELKAEPSGFKPTSDKARAVMQQMVDDGFQWFKGLVRERRNLDSATVDRLSDGRVYSGRQALAEKLIDGLGTEVEARSWLDSEKKIALSLKTITREPPPLPDKGWLGLLLGRASLSEWLGIEALKARVDAARLDGLLVLWHPVL